MKKNAKRFLALLLAAALMLSVTACTAGDNGGDGDAEEVTSLSLLIGSHSSHPYTENWAIWDYLKEITGIDLEITAIPGENFATKIPLMMASPETFPDMMHTWMKETVDDYALTGAYISYDERLDMMPNYSAFLDDLSDKEYEVLTAQHTSGDGKMYSSITKGKSGASGYTWMYRKDIFEKHGLEVPKTAEDLYQVSKKLKELYPNSYPLCFRDGLGKFIGWGPAWQNDFTFRVFYDYKTEEWKYGTCEPVTRDLVEYFLKLKEADLVPPDYITMPGKSWEELMTTDRGFITMDYVTRIDFFNDASRSENPDYTMAIMAPPIPDVETGSARVVKMNNDLTGYCVLNTGNEARITRAFEFIDSLYTKEAYELLSWGKEGETYEVVDGVRKFILEGNETPQTKYGFFTHGTGQWIDPAANEESYSAEQVKAFRELEKYIEDHASPDTWITFTDEEESILASYRDDIEAYAQEGLSKFMLGQRPMSEWDSFIEGFEEMGVNEMLDVYRSASERFSK